MRKNLFCGALLTGALLAAAPATAQAPWERVGGTPVPGYGYTSVLLAPSPGCFWQLYGAYPMRATAYDYVLNTINGGTTVNQQQLTACGTPCAVLRDLSALTSQTAWVIKLGTTPTGVLLYTTTGPAGFAAHPTPLPVANAQRVHFFTATRGVVIAQPTPGATTWPIYLTTDAGATWQPVASPPPFTGGIGTIVAKQGLGNSLWLSTDQKTVLRTSDQGASWAATPGIGRVAFEDEQKGLACDSTAAGQQLLSTTNGGQTWTAVAFAGPSICTTTTMTAIPGAPGTYVSVGWRRNYASGSYPRYDGFTAISRNRGLSWTTLPVMNAQFMQVVATSSTEVWASTNDQFNTTGISSVLRLTGNVLATKQPTSSELTCYPNPTSGLLQVAGSLLTTGLHVQVYNALGQLCHTSQLSSAAPAIDLSALPGGLYELTLRTAAGPVYSQRVQKQE